MNGIDYAARIAKGAALLDEKRPGWERLLDLDTLDIRSGDHCVTAQLSGVHSWWRGMEMLDLTEEDDGTYISHGFNAEERHINGVRVADEYDQGAVYDTLNTLWKALITTRLAAGQGDG